MPIGQLRLDPMSVQPGFSVDVAMSVIPPSGTSATSDAASSSGLGEAASAAAYTTLESAVGSLADASRPSTTSLSTLGGNFNPTHECRLQNPTVRDTNRAAYTTSNQSSG